MGKTLVLIGLGIAGLGLLMMLGLPFGRLPGDFAVKRGNCQLLLSAGDLDHPESVLLLIAALRR